LEEAATQILTGSHFIDVQTLIKTDTEGLETQQQVETGLQHIIADIVNKNPKVSVTAFKQSSSIKYKIYYYNLITTQLPNNLE
jgi:hypothetical protein